MAGDLSKIRKWGNSRVIVVPPRLLKLLGWNERDLIHLTAEQGELVMQKLVIPKRRTRANVSVTVTEGDAA